MEGGKSVYGIPNKDVPRGLRRVRPAVSRSIRGGGRGRRGQGGGDGHLHILKKKFRRFKEHLIQKRYGRFFDFFF